MTKYKNFVLNFIDNYLILYYKYYMIHIYVLEECPYSIEAVKILEKQGIPFIAYMVPRNETKKNKYKKHHKMNTFPQIFVDLEKIEKVKKSKKTKKTIKTANLPIKKIIKHANILKLGGHSDLQNILQICLYLQDKPGAVSLIKKLCE